MKQFQDFILVGISLPFLLIAIGVTGIAWVGFMIYAAADEALAMMVKRKLWGCKWCNRTFKRGGYVVWLPQYGQFQGHGMCRKCAKKIMPDIQLPRGGGILIELLCALAFAAMVVIVALL